MNTLGKRTIRTLGRWGMVIVLLTLVSACGVRPTPLTPAESEKPPGQIIEQNVPPTLELDTIDIEPDLQAAPADLAPVDQSDCPDLDSLLFQITQSATPLEMAEQLQLTAKEGKIQVVLVLDGQDTSFLQSYQAEISSQSGTQVQAFVPVAQLCNLANAANVLAVRPPARPIQQ